jgi:hypothetical protein
MGLERRKDGELILTTGKSRSGKTTVTLRSVQDEPRLLVWDFLGRDWPQSNCERIEGIPALTHRLMEVGAGPARISYRAPELTSLEFSSWARCCMAWLHYGPAVIVAEELADVVHPGKAPAGWGELVRAGLGYGATIYGLTQRIQETDKSIFGNATRLRIFRTAHDGDAAYIAKATGIPAERISSLNRWAFLEKNCDTGELELHAPA